MINVFLRPVLGPNWIASALQQHLRMVYGRILAPEVMGAVLPNLQACNLSLVGPLPGHSARYVLDGALLKAAADPRTLLATPLRYADEIVDVCMSELWARATSPYMVKG